MGVFWPFFIFSKVFTSRRPAVVPVVWRAWLTCPSCTPESLIRRSEAFKKPHQWDSATERGPMKILCAQGHFGFFKPIQLILIKKFHLSLWACFSTHRPHSIFLLANTGSIIRNEWECAVTVAFLMFSYHLLLQWSHFCAPSPLLSLYCLLASRQLCRRVLHNHMVLSSGNALTPEDYVPAITHFKSNSHVTKRHLVTEGVPRQLWHTPLPTP